MKHPMKHAMKHLMNRVTMAHDVLADRASRPRRWSACLAGALALVALAGTPACAFQDGGSPDARRRAAAEAARAGRYDDALRIYEGLAADASVEPAGRAADARSLVRLLVEVGRDEDAVALAARWSADSAMLRAAAVALGDAHGNRGRVEDADRLYALAARATPDSIAARLARADLSFERGDLDAAAREYDALLATYARAGGRLRSDELAAVATAARRLGRDDPQSFKDALRLYDEAIAADSANLAARVALGELFLDKYNMKDAAATLEGVLAVNPNHPAALVALARLRQADGAPGASALVERALAAAPGYAPARAFRARILFEVEDFDGAEAEAERALAAAPGAPGALAVLAAARHLRLDGAGVKAASARVTGGAPRRAEFQTELAELVARNRLYADAATFARQAVQLDPVSPRARAQLGVNLLRTGDIAAGRRELEAAFARDPYDVWAKNTLDLLDATASYREIATPNFRIVLDAREADLVGPLAAELAEEAHARFATRYGWRPAGPVRLELYTRHADFSVRTIGLAGLGALGVSFGPVVAMDSPAARDAGDFNWGSTLWHEVAHTFTLGASGHRVPRWLSEGISVYEERRARPGWGADASPAFIAAWAAGRVPPPSRMNDGFMRPAYPAQLGFSYLAASLVCEYLEERHGADALPRLLHAYRDGRATEAAFQEVLGVTPGEVDRGFDEWMRARYARQIAAVRGSAPGDSVDTPLVGGRYGEALAAGARALQAGQEDVALRELERAKELFPGAGGAEGPHWLLATLHERRGDVGRAAAELAALTAVDEDDHRANLKLAELRMRLNDRAGAAEALERTLWTSPYDVTVHTRLAELGAELGRRQQVVRARQAVLALGPADEAEARYRLALAWRDAGDAAAARREVLRALEIAPAFEAAQTLLLELSGGAGGAR